MPADARLRRFKLDGNRRLVSHGLRLLAVSAALLLQPDRAMAVPSFAMQTGQPCAACHVGAFGPQLKQVARDFKLFGYSSNDTKDHFPPIAMTTQNSFTHTDTAQPGATPHFGPNDNFSLDQVSLYYAGLIAPKTGAFVQVTYDGVARQFTWDNLDVRHAREKDVLGTNIVYGVTVNNSPTVTDLWNSTPTWGFPYNSSKLAAGPTNSALIDGGLGQQVMGVGAYTMINDWVYLEVDAYKGLGRDVRNALGSVPVSSTDSVDGLAPYWRVAVQHEFGAGEHYFELGTYGISANIFPGGAKISGSDHITDVAFDANYQWLPNPASVSSDMISAHATFINERLDLNASGPLNGTNSSDSLRTFRADVSYSIDATYTPTVQYFQIRGSNDPVRFGTANGSPNSEGVIAEIAYVPWGKPDSPVRWFNGRLALQYVAYSKFDGTTSHASDHNTIFLNLWLALAFNR